MNAGEPATVEELVPVELWREWKETCALAACADATRACFHRFAGHRFRRYAARLSGGRPAGFGDALRSLPDAATAWHLFETHLMVKTTRAGKRYKDWLFARAGTAGAAALPALAAGATLIIRDVVREHVRRECTVAWQVSLQAPLGGEGERALTIEDLLPAPGHDPAAATAHAEYPALAATLARVLLDDMPRPLRVAVLARALGVPLSAAAVTAAAGRGKSQLNHAFATLGPRVRAGVRQHYPDEGADGQAALVRATIIALQDLIIEWGKLEIACAPLFNRVMEENR